MKRKNFKISLIGLGVLATLIGSASKVLAVTPQKQKARAIETRIIQNQATNSGVNLLSELEVKKIATQAVDINLNDVQYFKVKLEQEDDYVATLGKPFAYIYEVEFLHGGFEYEFDIEATTGQILKTQVDSWAN